MAFVPAIKLDWKYSCATPKLVWRGQVETVDRGGTFLGSLRTVGPKPANLGLALLEAGLAQLSERFDPDRTSGGRELVAAQERARAARLKARAFADLIKVLGS